MKKQLVNTETDKDVHAFLENVTPKRRKEDANVLLDLLKEITGKEPKIWGVSIIGFGKYTYQRKNGDEYEWFNVGFSPGKSRLSIYLMFDVNQEVELLKKLGKYKTGKGCLYLNKLDDVDLNILKQLLQKSDRWTR